jgi:hypothetical protein
MKLKLISIIFLAVFINNCGFKVVDSRVDFKMINIITTGDKKISYNLKNKLLLNSNNNNEKSIKIILNTNKKKSIYERNIKNEITKYSIKITSNVEVINLSNGKTDKFSVSNDGIFNVGLRHSSSRNNENKLISLLTEDILEKILSNLSKKSNDL